MTSSYLTMAAVKSALKNQGVSNNNMCLIGILVHLAWQLNRQKRWTVWDHHLTLGWERKQVEKERNGTFLECALENT